MGSASKPRLALAGLLVASATATLVWFGNGLNPWWPLLWFAPLPVLWFALRSSRITTALVAGASWLIGSLNLWGYFHLLGLPFLIWLSMFALASIIFTASVLLFRALVLRGAVWRAMLAFPAAWTACEYIRNLLSVHATAGSLAYTQLRFLPLLQLASIAGPWGITYLLLLFPAALAIGLHLLPTGRQHALRVAGAAFSVILAVLIFGVVRLKLPAEQPEIEVGLIASDTDIPAPGADTNRLFTLYAQQAEQLAARGAQVIVLPEKIGVVAQSDSEAADTIFRSVADRTGATIVVGEVFAPPQAKYNQARIYSPHAPVLTYDKHHLLPPFESNLTPGATLTLFSKTPAAWAVAICKDMDFISPSRQYGQHGVGLMLVPAWDFNVDRTWHGHMAVMRGVEDGFSIVRAAKNGYLTVSDSRGRILAEARSDSAPFATLLTKVPAAHQSTVYLVFGDWFAWLAIVVLGITISPLLPGPERRRSLSKGLEEREVHAANRSRGRG
jgi:apolipoprotein N-acyltransferase